MSFSSPCSYSYPVSTMSSVIEAKVNEKALLAAYIDGYKNTTNKKWSTVSRSYERITGETLSTVTHVFAILHFLGVIHAISLLTWEAV